MDAKQAWRRAVAQFDARVREVRPDQWGLVSPCPDWDARAVVEHVVGEQHQVAAVLVGEQPEPTGAADGPAAAWTRASGTASAAVEADPLTRILHLPVGSFPASAYVAGMAAELVVHAWDLARAIAGDDKLDPELVDFAAAALAPVLDGWRAAGELAPPVTVPDGADPQTRLLAMLGRQG